MLSGRSDPDEYHPRADWPGAEDSFALRPLLPAVTPVKVSCLQPHLFAVRNSPCPMLQCGTVCVRGRSVFTKSASEHPVFRVFLCSV